MDLFHFSPERPNYSTTRIPLKQSKIQWHNAFFFKRFGLNRRYFYAKSNKHRMKSKKRVYKTFILILLHLDRTQNAQSAFALLKINGKVTLSPDAIGNCGQFTCFCVVVVVVENGNRTTCGTG